jgi:hypothetical protein
MYGLGGIWFCNEFSLVQKSDKIGGSTCIFLATQPICLVMLLMRMFAPIFGGKFMEKDFHVEFARTYLVLLCRDP